MVSLAWVQQQCPRHIRFPLPLRPTLLLMSQSSIAHPVLAFPAVTITFFSLPRHLTRPLWPMPLPCHLTLSSLDLSMITEGAALLPGRQDV